MNTSHSPAIAPVRAPVRMVARLVVSWLMVAVGGGGCGCGIPSARGDGWELLNSRLTAVRQQQATAERELQSLGRMEMGVASERIGAQFYMAPSPPAVPPFVQLDLGTVRSLDTVVIVPAVSQFGGQGSAAYAFPEAFRVDASNDADFNEFTPLASIDQTRFESQRALPMVIRHRTQARYVRVTIVDLALVADRWTYALGEIMVLDGNHNVALGARVRMRSSPRIPPKWHYDYLVDGRTTLGPPIVEDLPEFDGAYSTDDPQGERWMSVDLGQAYRIDEIRLHPIHARQGNSLPGYSFPRRFRLELRDQPDSEPVAVQDSGEEPFSNPGNNPVVCHFAPVTARYLRIVCLEASVEDPQRFGLSEVRVYAQGRNVARGGTARLSGPATERGPEMLIDGYTSYGRLLELPAWIDRWDRYRQARLTQQRAVALTQVEMQRAQSRAAWLGGGSLMLVLLGGGAAALARRRREAQEKRRFRMRLAQDLHDEIGSNLAAIARLGEVVELESDNARAKTDWQAVRQLALECTDSMRETLWLLGGPRYSGGTIFDRLQATATRMLGPVELCWDQPAALPVVSHDSEVSRELYLIFKELIANVARHAQAQRVTVSIRFDVPNTAAGTTASSTSQMPQSSHGWLQLEVRDDGVGMGDEEQYGMGLSNIRQRTRKLGGVFQLMSAPGEGTTVSVRVRLK